MRIVPVQTAIMHEGQDWLGRGPSIRAEGRVFYHAALDLGVGRGIVVAPESGRVVFAVEKIPGKGIFGGYGPQVVAIHGASGYYHWLGHLKDIQVKRNQYVDVGDVVALSAGTKWPHVHWEVRQKLIPYKDPDYWPWTVTVDPIRWLKGSTLTARDAIRYVKARLPRDAYKDRKKRMAVIRGNVKYPIRLRWPKPVKIMIDLKKRQAAQQTLTVFSGVGLGLLLLYVVTSR